MLELAGIHQAVGVGHALELRLWRVDPLPAGIVEHESVWIGDGHALGIEFGHDGVEALRAAVAHQRQARTGHFAEPALEFEMQHTSSRKRSATQSTSSRLLAGGKRSCR